MTFSGVVECRDQGHRKIRVEYESVVAGTAEWAAGKRSHRTHQVCSTGPKRGSKVGYTEKLYTIQGRRANRGAGEEVASDPEKSVSESIRVNEIAPLEESKRPKHSER